MSKKTNADEHIFLSRLDSTTEATESDKTPSSQAKKRKALEDQITAFLDAGGKVSKVDITTHGYKGGPQGVQIGYSERISRPRNNNTKTTQAAA